MVSSAAVDVLVGGPLRGSPALQPDAELRPQNHISAPHERSALPLLVIIIFALNAASLPTPRTLLRCPGLAVVCFASLGVWFH